MPSEYVRLTRRSAGLAAYRSLWKGRDHLLLVTSYGYSEKYQRFQYADIKTFLIMPSERRLYCGWTWMILTFLFGIVASLPLLDGKIPYFAGPMFVIFLGAAIWNHLLGPGCHLYLVTRVQTLRLPVHRYRRAEKFVEKLLPEINAAQSELLAPVEIAPVEPPSLS